MSRQKGNDHGNGDSDGNGGLRAEGWGLRNGDGHGNSDGNGGLRAGG